MPELHIDPIISDAVEGKPLPKGHQARTFAADLPEWHPVHRMLTGESQWLGRIDAVYAFFRLFCEVYDDFIWPPSETTPQVDAATEFRRMFPNDVVYDGNRYRMHDLHAKARAAIETTSEGFPPMRTLGLDAFDRAFAQLVRSIRST